MPWITVHLAQEPPSIGSFVDGLAGRAAAALGLSPTDVLVQAHVAAGASGLGAVVTIAGRRRNSAAERALEDAVRETVATSVGIDGDLVAVLRTGDAPATAHAAALAEAPEAAHAAAQPHIVDEPWPSVVGRPGFAQGGYGERGNLEVVACDPEDGLWVGWFNTDREEHCAGAPVGQWSSALRFGQGHRYVAAGILQVPAGPDWIESVALTDAGEVRRLVWSPEAGYVDYGLIATAETVTRLECTAAGEQVCVVAQDGRAIVLRALPGSDYPDLEWSAEPLTTLDGRLLDSALHGDHVDLMVGGSDGRVTVSCVTEQLPVLAGSEGRFVRSGAGWAAAVIDERAATVHTSDQPPVPLGEADAIELAAVSLDGELGWHAMLRSGSVLRHLYRDGCGWAGEEESLVSRQWVSGPAPATIHRPDGA